MTTIVTALADMAGARLSLASVQAGEEIERQKHALALGMAAVAFACSGMLLATLLVAVAFWDTHRVVALAALALVHLACSGAAFMALRKSAEIRAREKRLLIMRSTLARLKAQVAAERIARSPAMVIAGSLMRLGRGLRGIRATRSTVR
jgi:uncharacterized membrane protein YqjE